MMKERRKITLQKAIGNSGEKKAVYYLESKGYHIIALNYRYKRYEIDIIAEKNDTLVFIEVKTRKDSYFGQPEQAVNSQKEEMIISAAEQFIAKENWNKKIRFDIISIILSNEEIRHFEDAF